MCVCVCVCECVCVCVCVRVCVCVCVCIIYKIDISTPSIKICKIGFVVNFDALFNCYTVDKFLTFIE